MDRGILLLLVGFTAAELIVLAITLSGLLSQVAFTVYVLFSFLAFWLVLTMMRKRRQSASVAKAK